jgi:GDP-4-dehydro-6-deoxy-D-mannose reductase
MLALSRVPIEVRQDLERMRPADIPEIVCDASRLRERTGWQPTIPFEQSIQDILEYWRRETTQNL